MNQATMEPDVPMQGVASKDVVVVTVTYGDRQALLRQVLDSLPAQGVARVVVVDNGAQWPVSEMLRASYGDFVDVVEMGCNSGSAPGFAAGMRRATETGAELIWLLDDDNCPQPDALTALLDEYQHQVRSVDAALLAVGVFRPVGQQGIAPHLLTPRHSSYCGFHVIDIPRKLIKRTPARKWLRHVRLPATVVVGVAAYSGLLFSNKVLQRVGLPREDFVLYCDDYEWTGRISSQGGRVVLVARAIVIDLQRTWGGLLSNHPLSLLHGGGDAVAYYAMRNEVFFYGAVWRKNIPVYYVNRAVFTSLLWVMAVATRRRARYALLRRAANDGAAGCLGINPAFRL
jgi:GT2 family glycosyltransferase